MALVTDLSRCVNEAMFNDCEPVLSMFANLDTNALMSSDCASLLTADNSLEAGLFVETDCISDLNAAVTLVVMLLSEIACARILTMPPALAASCCVPRDCDTNLISENPRAIAVSQFNDCHTLAVEVLSLERSKPSDKL